MGTITRIAFGFITTLIGRLAPIVPGRRIEPVLVRIIPGTNGPRSLRRPPGVR